jgi:hypothetical protein
MHIQSRLGKHEMKIRVLRMSGIVEDGLALVPARERTSVMFH